MSQPLTDRSNELVITGESKILHEKPVEASDTVRYINNPHGTPLSTIVEQKSSATLTQLTVRTNASNRASTVRRRVSKSLDPAALQEFKNIFAEPTTGRDSSSDPADISKEDVFKDRIMLNGGASPTYPAFTRSPTPEGQRKWPPDRATASNTSTRPAPSRSAPRQARHILRSIRDCFRTTTPAQHGQTAFSRKSIDSVRSRCQWRPANNSFGYRGTHPLARDDGRYRYTSEGVPVYGPPVASPPLNENVSRKRTMRASLKGLLCCV